MSNGICVFFTWQEHDSNVLFTIIIIKCHFTQIQSTIIAEIEKELLIIIIILNFCPFSNKRISKRKETI